MEVSWHQRGDELEISASYTLQRRGGGALRGDARPGLLAFIAPEESLSFGWESESRDREFLRVARAIPLPGFGAFEHGARVKRTDRVPISLFKEGAGIILALTLEDERSRSLPSRRTVLLPATPGLKEPLEAQVQAQEKQIVITWSAPEDSRVSDIRVYKRATTGEGGDTGNWRPLGVYKATIGRAVDESASYGERLQYSLTSTRKSKATVVESALVTLDPLHYLDTFPPQPAFDLEAVAESGKIHVLWFPGGSKDETLAVVERQSAGSDDWHEVARIDVPDADFIDLAVTPDTRYRYRIVSVDGVQNRATPTDASRWVSPRSLSERKGASPDGE